jgi:hypothetical protein
MGEFLGCLLLEEKEVQYLILRLYLELARGVWCGVA